jgi:hypothetical protein
MLRSESPRGKSKDLGVQGGEGQETKDIKDNSLDGVKTLVDAVVVVSPSGAIGRGDLRLEVGILHQK